MYKKITSNIVEEHFDHPLAAKIAKKVNSIWEIPLRCYPDGVHISSFLPLSYQEGTPEQNCGNCKAYDPATSSCMQWMEPVRAEYVCDAWTSI